MNSTIRAVKISAAYRGSNGYIHTLYKLYCTHSKAVQMHVQHCVVSAPGKAILHGEHAVVHGKVGVIMAALYSIIYCVLYFALHCVSAIWSYMF